MIGSAALIVIGSELTRGIIQDRHGQLVSRAMSGLGIHMSQIVEVPDDGSIASILSAIVRKNDLVVITGGLGPTSDDMTRQCIATVASSPLERNEESWNALHERIGEKIHGANEKQTMIPRSFCRIANANGTADGFYGYTPSGCLIVALPGPPREMQPMFESVVVPLVSRLSGHGEVTRREYTSFITAEAKLEELTQQVAPGLTWATRFQDYCISLYLSGGDEEEKDRAVSELRRVCGSHLIADGDTSALDILLESVHRHGLTLSCAESCTGGLASGMLTSPAGASEYFLGSVVSYSNEVKESVLGVDSSIIAEHGAVSRQCAQAMADGVMALTGSQCAFSITGVAGPGESERKKVGTVCFAFAMKGRRTRSLVLHFSSWGRESVRRKSVTSAMLLMASFIEGEDVEQVASTWAFI